MRKRHRRRGHKNQRILLMGNPNVGKSAIFTHLTGVKSVTSNYPGTTVNYAKGQMSFIKAKTACEGCGKHGHCRACDMDNFIQYDVIDVPGTYRLDPKAESERVAVDMIDSGDIILNIIDSTNLERNLYLTFLLTKFNKPMVVVLNMWDDTTHRGITIDPKVLEEKLGLPVVTTSGATGEGIKELAGKIAQARVQTKFANYSSDRIWEAIGDIVSCCQRIEHHHHTFLERIQDLSVHPVWGTLIALGVLYGVLQLVLTLGELLVGWIAKLFEIAYSPLMYMLNDALSGSEIFRFILIGNIEPGGIAFETAMGVLTTGVYMVLGVVLPYIIVFYIILGFLEDLGYLARVAVVFDKMFHKIGLHGFSIIPMMLSFGCNVPGVLAIRNLESRREKFITAAVMCTTIPCVAQAAVMFHTAGQFGMQYIIMILVVLASVWLILGSVLNFAVRGKTPSLIMEIPPYRKPILKNQAARLLMRVKGFLLEALPYVLGGILFINILMLTGALEFLGNLAKPVISGVLGLPKDSVSAFLIGIVRKDASVIMLEPLGLTAWQNVTAIISLIIYFPCMATFVVMIKELGVADSLKALVIMICIAVITGGLLNALGVIGSALVVSAIFIVFALLVAFVFGYFVKKRDKKELL